MTHFIYQTLIRTYSDNVEKGYADTDLSPRERRLVAIMLNLASNGEYANYPPSQEDRNKAIRRLSNIVWDGRWLAYAMVKGSAAEREFDNALERTNEILQNI